MPLEPPLPLTAKFTTPPDRVTVTFDHKLVTAPVLDTANWTVEYQLFTRMVVAAAAAGSDVVLSLNAGLPDGLFDLVSFAPPPFDVVGLNGVDAPAFANFLIT